MQVQRDAAPKDAGSPGKRRLESFTSSFMCQLVKKRNYTLKTSLLRLAEGLSDVSRPTVRERHPTHLIAFHGYSACGCRVAPPRSVRRLGSDTE